MESWSESVVMFDEDYLDSFLFKIKKKVQDAWKAGYQPDAECEMTFTKNDEEEDEDDETGDTCILCKKCLYLSPPDYKLCVNCGAEL